jgi:hypothetical protein
MALAVAGLARPLRAENMVTEVLPAGFRDAGELAAILRPLVPPPGSVNAFENQLVIRTTAHNLEELKRVLASLDTAPANLLISVRRSLDEDVRRDLAAARAELRSGDVGVRAGARARGGGAAVDIGGRDASVGAQVSRRLTTRRGDDVQTVRVLEGREAFIRTGESVPVGERAVVITGAGVSVADGVRYEEFGTGFYVRARLGAERVTLEIVPSQRRRRGDGSARVQEVGTTVSGSLGRWLEIGAVDTSSSRDSSDIGTSRRITTRRDDALYLKVERLD